MQRDESTLIDMYRAGELAQQFIGGIEDVEEFQNDLKTISAVQHQLLIPGEATKRLSAEYREAHPEIPWKSMAGLRDILIHAYDAVDVYELWYILQHDLPELMNQLRPLVPRKEE